MTYPAERYAEDVLNGTIIAPETVKQACRRYFNDHEIKLDKGWSFDTNAAKKAIEFFPKLLKHFQGEFSGQKFELFDWQKFVVWNVYGWKKANRYRRFNYVYITVPRKAGKSDFIAGEAIRGLGFDGEDGAEVYSAATTSKQAKIVFNASKAMVNKSKWLKQYISVYTHNMHILEKNSKYEALSRESSSEEGSNPHYGIIDEYHLHDKDDIFEMLKSGMGTRRQPLIWIITTRGFRKFTPCYNYEQICLKVLSGVLEQDNLFALIYGPDKGDDWESPETWAKVNPSYRHLEVTRDFYEREYKDAKNNPSKVINFKTKNVNEWTSQISVWIDDSNWMACKEVFDIDFLKGRDCYCGLDLASVSDITQLTLTFFIDEWDCFVQLYYIFVPEDTAKERVSRDNVNYDVWIRDGEMIQTPGNTTDYDAIRRYISGYYVSGTFVEHDDSCIADMFNLISIAYDPWNSSQLITDLINDGIECNGFRQGYATMSSPTKGFKKLVLERKMKHNGNRPMRWMISNVNIIKDPAENEKISKKHSSDKVDGPVSAVMSYGEYVTKTSDDVDLDEIYKNGING
jgi:phage terminase large subunit-like protein